MKNIFSFLTLLLSTSAIAQTITELKFPYHKGYSLSMEGENKTYDVKGNLTATKKIGFIYSIPHEEMHKKENWVVFRVKDYTNTDTTLINNTFLTQDSKGMTWWTANPESNEFDKHRTLAIKLPLEKGKSWKSYLQDMKTTSRCISTDTLIVTNIGTYYAFGVETRLVIEKTNNYQVVLYFTEFYNQEIGKIKTEDKTYLEYLGVNKKILLSESSQSLSNYTGYNGPK